ncbi:IS21 family transposase [Mesorhizobium huakuii]|uniref:IS21 family transposase n=4 Tax=Mesorhizobium TaxID=68287 RepID=A0A7G6T153_9HYPH|nr:IS21 family transposase [Mesorhizobium huakuii]QND60485.1 IS21 family transposase [Mesorhizobium huakuii]QND60984.1 IS21 family transposase [Mesorhizobium huakuii]QND62368.1 IS21 family transposase [Mesorhizobium huakuii]
MTISPELEAQILRLYHAEKWRCGTIARQLHVHHTTVHRVLAQAGLPRHKPLQRASIIEPYLPFIEQTLEKFPSLTASRLYAMVRERGYRGLPTHFRHLVALHRPRKPAEAFLRLRTLPGEQGQVDWAHFGHIEIGNARRPLMAFVMVLSYSRDIYLRFFLDARMENFLRGHVGAFNTWCGLPRVLLYDNLKSAVLERQGDAIRFHPTLLAFAGFYRFEPRPVAVARGNEKGRVERAIRHIREAFFIARRFTDLDDLNAQAEQWCRNQAADRPCPEDRTMTVRQAFAQEQPLLLPLPANPYPVEEQVAAKVGKTPYVRFDLNDYSVPHAHVRRTLSVRADLGLVRVFDGAKMIASHRRSYDRDQQIEDPQHLKALVAIKREARQHRGLNSLTRAVPACQTLMIRAAERGSNIGAITNAMLKLLDLYGAQELQAAVEEALHAGASHSRSVRDVLERRRVARGAPPPVETSLPEHVRRKDTTVRPHRLDSYDQLTLGGKDDE